MKGTKRFLIVLAVFTAACADATHPGSTPGGKSVAPFSLEAEPPLSQVAGALARGLGSSTVRRQILATMRASTQVEHQLVLADYLRSPEGAGLLTASAAVLDTDADGFLTRVAGLDKLAQLVVSVPLREHRLTWRGSPYIGVAGSWDPDVLAFTVHEPRGQRVDATEMSHIQQYDAFFYLAPRENWGTRIGRQADVPGVVIQDLDDGETAVVWTYQVGDAEPLTLDHGAFESEADFATAHAELLRSLGPIAEGSIGGHWYDDPLVTHRPMFMTGFASHHNTEWGREEVRITVGYTNASGISVTGTEDFGGVKDGHWYDRYLEMLPVSPRRGGANFSVSAIELDIIGNDDLGSAVVTHATGPGTYSLFSFGSRRVRSRVGLTW